MLISHFRNLVFQVFVTYEFTRLYVTTPTSTERGQRRLLAQKAFRSVDKAPRRVSTEGTLFRGPKISS